MHMRRAFRPKRVKPFSNAIQPLFNISVPPSLQWRIAGASIIFDCI